MKCPGFTWSPSFPWRLDWRQLRDLQPLQRLALRTLAAPQPDRLAVFPRRCRRAARQVLLRRVRAGSRAAAVVCQSVRMTDSASAPSKPKERCFPAAPCWLATALPNHAPAAGDRPGIAAGDVDVAILGYQCWRRYFHGSTAALGKTIRVQGKACTVWVVAPRISPIWRPAAPSKPSFRWAPDAARWSSRQPQRRLGGYRQAQAWGHAGGRPRGAGGAVAADSAESKSRIQVESAVRGTGFNFARRRFTFPLRF